MYNKQFLSRYILVLIIIFCFLFSIDVIISHYLTKVHNNDCSMNIFSYTVTLVIFQYISCIILLINLLRAINLFYDYNQHLCKSFFEEDVGPFEGCSFTMLFISTIASQIIFFESDIMNGSSTTCSTEDAEILFKITTYPFLWIPFLQYLFISTIIIKKISLLLYDVIKEANIFNSCFNHLKYIFSKLKISKTRVIPIPPNEKEIQTDNDIFIPLASIKNDIKPFICIVCMVNNIDIVLDPCYHICMCNDCYKQLNKKSCPCCNKNISIIKPIYLSSLEFA